VTRSLLHSRYYDYHLLFGDEFVDKASKSSCFVVGAGALGCEFIKLFSLMGLGHKSGRLAVTDDDNI
jgi:ubiquitin-activating enzyme E1